MFEEFNKMFLSGNAVANFKQLRSYNLFKYFFPATEHLLNSQQNEHLVAFIQLAMKNTDIRIANEQRVIPAFLLAAMLWYPLQNAIAEINATQQLTAQDAFFAGYNQIMSEQQGFIAIPKRFQLVMKDIWILQDRLTRRESKKVYKTFEHPKFRAGFDFMLLRSEIENNELIELAKWWQDFQTAAPETQTQMVKLQTSKTPARRNNRKRRKPRNKASQSTS